MSYITYMAQRMIEMHRVLKPTGSLYLHCDPTASHYLKIILDRIFGSKNFRNEVIWSYKTGGVSKHWFGRKHDVILFYTKSDKKSHTFNISKERSFNRGFKPYRFKGVEEFKDAEGRWYTMAALRDVWEINPVGRTAKERTGYPTQKPLALLERIIKASSKEGDVVLDPFCGCATTCVAAQNLDRKWIGIDIEEKAAQVLLNRLSDDAGLFSDFIHRVDIPERTDVTIEEPNKSVKDRLHKDQEGVCNGCKGTYLLKDFEIDHITPRVKGGGNYYGNYQLLCGSCNRIKGPRHMEYLMARVAKEEAHFKANTYG